MTKSMTDEMSEAAEELFEAAQKYKKLFDNLGDNKPVVYIEHNKTGEGVFITDSHNTEVLKNLAF